MSHRYLYSVTYGQNLPGIARRGLVPQGGRGIGSGIFAEDSVGNVFLCGLGDVKHFGYHDAEYWRRNYGGDYPFRDTVVLRVPRKVLDKKLLRQKMTTADAGDEYRYAGSIDPENIEVQVEGEWEPVEVFIDREEGVSPCYSYGRFRVVGKKRRRF